MIIETKRLILRPWTENDAESLYEYAKDPRVGPIAGWPVHTSVENSREIIRNVLSTPDTFAVTIKGQDEAVGSIGLMFRGDSNLELDDCDSELGYWLGVPFWGRGYITEAGEALIKYGFEKRGCRIIWSGYFDGNEKSRRVQEKCGFKYVRTDECVPWPLLGCFVTEHITRLTKEEWEKRIATTPTRGKQHE